MWMRATVRKGAAGSLLSLEACSSLKRRCRLLAVLGSLQFPQKALHLGCIIRARRDVEILPARILEERADQLLPDFLICRQKRRIGQDAHEDCILRLRQVPVDRSRKDNQRRTLLQGNNGFVQLEIQRPVQDRQTFQLVVPVSDRSV